VLILPAGLALEDLKGLKSLNAIIVVDISSAPHIDWSMEQDNASVRTWDQLLETEAVHEPSDPPPVAIEDFVNLGTEHKPVDFSQEVLLPPGSSLTTECDRGRGKSIEASSERSCFDRE